MHTENILSVLNRANDKHLTEGSQWYRAAHTFAVGLSETYDVTVRQAAGVIAALSPQLEWGRNMRYADQFMAEGYAPTLGLGRRKAALILSGTDPDVVFTPPAKAPASQGAKVRAFFACILDPHCDDVVIDRHSYDVVTGAVGDNSTRGALGLKGVYDAIREAYRSVAVGVGLIPNQLQAITWLQWKSEKTYDLPIHRQFYLTTPSMVVN